MSLDDFGRSPIKPRQLHDLRLLPTATDPRPLFIPSAEGNRDMGPQPFKEFPKLLWSVETGEEITVEDAADPRLFDATWTVVPPMVTSMSTMDALKSQLDALSPEDRALVLEEQKRARLTAIKDKLAGLSDAQLEAALNSVGREQKRGPGRPRKAIA